MLFCLRSFRRLLFAGIFYCLFQLQIGAREAVMIEDYSFKVGTNEYAIRKGEKVDLQSETGEKRVIFFTNSEGRKILTQVPEKILEIPIEEKKEVPPPLPVAEEKKETSSPSAPPHVSEKVAEEVPITKPAASSPFPFKIGTEQSYQFDALPDPERKPKWFPYGFDAKKEHFKVYIPKGYVPGKTLGLVGWTSSGDSAGFPKNLFPVLDELQLMAVSADNCGNNQVSERRAGLLVSAYLALKEICPLDPERLIVSGFSGGGRLSALNCFVHWDIWKGAVSWCGGNYYKEYPCTEKEKFQFWYGINANPEKKILVTDEDVRQSKKWVRFALVTGEKDFNLINSRDIHTVLKKENFRSLLIEEPGLEHRIGSAESFREALNFILQKESPRED